MISARLWFIVEPDPDDQHHAYCLIDGRTEEGIQIMFPECELSKMVEIRDTMNRVMVMQPIDHGEER